MEEQIIMEIKLQSYMNHPNVLKMYGYFHDTKNIYLILEFSSQCLFKDFRAKVQIFLFRVNLMKSKLLIMANKSFLLSSICTINILCIEI